LSRHPVVAVSTHQFVGCEGLESMVGKGALRTVLALPGGQRLAVWNVHLQSGTAGEVRLRQLDELCGWIAAAGDEARLVVGDFNCGPGSGEWPTFVHKLGAVGVELASAGQCTYDCSLNPCAANEPAAAIDHVFVDRAVPAGPAASWRIHDQPTEGTFLSDHFGVAVRVPMARPSVAVLR
jgi:endonuclease/exonuclease/phosphatase family metal-dependent hydrolase